MSDNYNLVAEQPDGTWACWRNLSVISEYVPAEPHRVYPSDAFEQAFVYADEQVAEYGTRIARFVAETRLRLTVLLSVSECTIPNLERLKELLLTCPGPDRTVFRTVSAKGVRCAEIGLGVDATQARSVLTKAGWSAIAGEDKHHAHT